MKRSWIGLGLLVVLLAVSLLVTFAMTRIHEPIEEQLLQAAECAMLGDWKNADLFYEGAKARWKQWERFRSCVADHTPIEEIDAAFASLTLYCRAREDLAFAAACSALARQIAAVGEAHEPVWWNLL